MAEKYRAIVHYHLKKGKKDQAIQFLEKNLLEKAMELGCHDIEILIDERNPERLIGMGIWNNFNEAKKFQSIWEAKEKELMQFCEKKPMREFYKIIKNTEGKARKAA